MQVHQGATRTVFLIGRYAFKLALGGVQPATVWEKICHGCLSNLKEYRFRTFNVAKDHTIPCCPVKRVLPLGLLHVMPRCEPITDEVWARIERTELFDLVERKRDSFGILRGRLVCIDYGS